MYQRGNLVVITEKENPKIFMFGMIVNVYTEGIYILSLDQGTFDDSKFKKYKRLGIKYGKYIRYSKYNIHVSGQAQEYYSKDETIRTLDRRYKHLTYKIKTDYHEYIATFKTFDNQVKTFSYVFIEKFVKNKKEFSGGFAIVNESSKIFLNEDALLNRARSRAEVNLYKQFSQEKED